MLCRLLLSVERKLTPFRVVLWTTLFLLQTAQLPCATAQTTNTTEDLTRQATLVFKGTGDCAAIDWTFLGLSLPQLALIADLAFAVYAIYLYKINTKH